MRFTRWWQYGLFGGVVLSLATIVKVVRAVIGGAVGQVTWTEAMGFAVAIFGMGFVCGVVVWGGRWISRRFGLFGDAIVGMVVMLVFFHHLHALVRPEPAGTAWIADVRLWGAAGAGRWGLGRTRFEEGVGEAGERAVATWRRG